MKELNIYVLEKAINEIAPELVDIYNIREDESEEQQIKTGRLHESRILGIMLKFYLEGKTKVTTRDVELEYKKYFKEIARSTISTYLNMLKKESTLIKERDGRVVYYLLREDPPNQLKAFWFTRLFCIDPVYYSRAIYFASLYSIADIVMQNHSEREFNGEIVENFKYIIGLIILFTLKNRCKKCSLCQFSNHEQYNYISEEINNSIRDRTDVLPDELVNILSEKYAEFPVFGGINIVNEQIEIGSIKELIGFANMYKKDFEFQYMVLNRRLQARILEKTQPEASELDSK